MKKRRKLKIFLLSLLVLVIAAGGYLLYEFKFKTYDVADEEVDEIVADPYIVELPDGSQVTIDEDGNINIVEKQEDSSKTSTDVAGENSQGEGSTQSAPDGSASAGDTNTNGSTGSAGSTGNKGNKGNIGSTGSNNSGGQEVTVASIKQKYTPVFAGIETQADTKINSLISRAKKEYKDKQANGESIQFGYFYNKYMGAANNLEASTDSVFNGVVKLVEKDLVANGFDKSYAQSFKDEYEAKKKARRDSILSKALGK